MTTVQLPQILVTGLPVSSEEAQKIREFCAIHGMFAIDWCHHDGTIGYIDASRKPLNTTVLKQDLTKIANAFPSLQIGVTLMSGSPGQYNTPRAQFSIMETKVTKELSTPHLGHPAPQRIKSSE